MAIGSETTTGLSQERKTGGRAPIFDCWKITLNVQYPFRSEAFHVRGFAASAHPAKPDGGRLLPARTGRYLFPLSRYFPDETVP